MERSLTAIRLRCRTTPGGCWFWEGAKTDAGYGNATFDLHYPSGKTRPEYIHRVVYQLVVGKIADGLTIDHLCRVRACCNPDHLEAVTQAENVRRGDSWKRNGLKTECKHGHPLVVAGVDFYAQTRRDGRPERRCKQCHAKRTRAYYLKQKAAS